MRHMWREHSCLPRRDTSLDARLAFNISHFHRSFLTFPWPLGAELTKPEQGSGRRRGRPPHLRDLPTDDIHHREHDDPNSVDEMPIPAQQLHSPLLRSGQIEAAQRDDEDQCQKRETDDDVTGM